MQKNILIYKICCEKNYIYLGFSIFLLKKVQIEGLINFVVMAYLSWIRICISPYGSGSGFYYTNPDPHHCLKMMHYNAF